MIVCSCTIRTEKDVKELVKKYQHRNLKKERLARHIWRDLGDGKVEMKDRCGACILQLVRIIEETRAENPNETN